MNSVSDSLKWVVAAAVAIVLGLASAHAQQRNGSPGSEASAAEQP